MSKILSFLVVVLISLFLWIPKVWADNPPSFVTIVNPVRGDEFWDIKDEKPEDAVEGQINILKQKNIPATWLVRFDALNSPNIVSDLKSVPSNSELGLFLEVTPSWAKAAGVNYHQSVTWHSAGSIFLTGYTPQDREKLIDTDFERFKSVFGYYPKSVGAWWIDAYSLSYMQNTYGIVSSLMVADQYTTDNYQIWGQYWGTPYYPTQTNALIPAQTVDQKIPVVMLQWAARDPVNGYGNGVNESTYSVQANDYIEYHNLGADYFSKLVDIYTKQNLNSFNQLTVGLENSYSWKKYQSAYQSQINILSDKAKMGQFSFTTMSQFGNWYLNNYTLSPPHIIVSDDPLGTNKKAVWYMDDYYRAGWFYDQNGSNFRDIRQYINGSEESCLKQVCSELDFATNATRVLDDVSFGQKWIVDPGQISNFKVISQADGYYIQYVNGAGKQQNIGLLPRDISLDGTRSTIDGIIMQNINPSSNQKPSLLKGSLGLNISWLQEGFDILKFIVFVILAIMIPGLVFMKYFSKDNSLSRIFISSVVGMVFLTLLGLVFCILHIEIALVLYVLALNVVFWRNKYYKDLSFTIKKSSIPIILIILLGTIFLLVPTLKSGLQYGYGIGYWGVNSHDGVWHLSLIPQLVKGVPPQNPTYSGTLLKNYHYLYDLLVALTNQFTSIDGANLIFRFYPVLISLLLGIGSYCFISRFAKTLLARCMSLYTVYFAGSFGWIVEYIKNKQLGGESDFWANQAVSFNLNPPFAISVIILLAIWLLMLSDHKFKRSTTIILVFLVGSLIGFKSYAGILMIASLGLIFIYYFIKDRTIPYLPVLIGSALVSLGILLPDYKPQQFFIFSPFWFIHSMIDSPDRIGWIRFSTARQAYQAKGEWLKLFLLESISLVIFIVGNLGMRILSLFLIFKTNLIKKSNFIPFLIIFSGLSFLIPLLFIQAGTSWNTIQFLYYLLIITALFAGVAVEFVIHKLPRILVVILVLMVILITPINSITSLQNYISNTPGVFLSTSETKALSFLSKQPNGVVLTYPYDEKVASDLNDPKPLFAIDSSYVAAYSQKPVFVEDTIQNTILQTDYLRRLILVKDFFQNSDYNQKRSFLKNSNIKYIYILKYYNIGFDEEKLGVKNIFENEEVKVYQVM